MIPDYLDIEDCYVCLKLINGTSVYGVCISHEDLEEDFGVEKIAKNSITLFAPVIYNDVSITQEDEVVKVIKIPQRYNPDCVTPFMNFPFEAILTAYNTDDSFNALYDASLSYLEEITDNVFDSHLENSEEFLRKAIENSKKMSNEEILNTLDEDSTRH